MNRFHVFTALLAVLLLALIVQVRLFAQETSDVQAGRPNIVLMMADDLGWADVGYQGHPVLQTPHLDAMAQNGLRFNRFYAGAPVCSPTRGSCLTGRHPFRYGIYSANVGHMRRPELTLAELLQAHGYVTGHFGKWHLGTLTKTVVESNRGGPRGAAHYAPPWDNGFDICFSTEAKVPTWDPLLKPKTGARNTWWDPVENDAAAVPYGTGYWTNGKPVTENLRGDDSRAIMDRAIPFIRQAAREKKPFFAVIWFHAPHLPVVAGPEYTKLYSDQEKYAQHYFGCITALDEQVGRLRHELRQLGVADNTLVTFCADNGPEGKAGSAPGSAGVLRGRKRDLFEGGIRVPGLLEWPAQLTAPRVTDLPASTSDYLPTVLDMLGVSLGDDRPLDGVSLLPLIKDKMTERPRPIAFESGRQLALIDNRYKIIHVASGKAKGGKSRADVTALPFMLFDLVEDPGEKHDLAKKHPEKVTRLATALAAWRQSCRKSLAGEDY